MHAEPKEVEGERRENQKAFYARTTYKQEKIPGCPRITVVGHHQGFEVGTAEVIPDLSRRLKIIDRSDAPELAR
jgi:hypothetical protein